MGVGHMVMAGQCQTEIAIRELFYQLVEQGLDLLHRDAAPRLTQCRPIDTGRPDHRCGVHAKACQVARNDPEVTGEDSLFCQHYPPSSLICISPHVMFAATAQGYCALWRDDMSVGTTAEPYRGGTQTIVLTHKKRGQSPLLG